MWPNPEQGTLSRIHELNNDWLVDPNWTKTILNPSRCAIKACH